MWAEAYEEAQPLLDRSLEEAQREGSVPHFVGLSAIRAWLSQRRGALADTEADARLSLTVGGRAPAYSRALALAMLVEVLTERGALDLAEEELAAAGMAEGGGTANSVGVLLCSRGRLRLAAGRPTDALADLQAAGRHLLAFGLASPAVAPCRSHAALALLAIDETAAARTLAGEEVALARAFGAPGALGAALRAAGIVTRGPAGVDLLREAVETLATSGAALEHARSLTDFGSALRRQGLRSHAREPLRRGLELAHRCKAVVLAERARTELLTTGARPRRPALSGVESLTPSELRVAEMAARGLTNREIAQALFVTTRTVEGHLTHAFQKLDASGRIELATHFRQAALASSSE